MNINKYLLGVVAAATLLVSCNDRELKELTSQAYIAQTGTQAGRIGSLQLGDSEVSTDINVRLSSPQAKMHSMLTTRSMVLRIRCYLLIKLCCLPLRL